MLMMSVGLMFEPLCKESFLLTTTCRTVYVESKTLQRSKSLQFWSLGWVWFLRSDYLLKMAAAHCWFLWHNWLCRLVASVLFWSSIVVL